MNHEAASEKLLELAYGELPEREARAVEAHAEACEPCRGELARIRETRAVMALLPIEPPPERGMGIVLAAARETAAARTRRSSLLPPWLWAGSVGAVAAAAVAVVSWQLAKTPQESALRTRDSDLMGRPPAVTVAPEPPPPAGLARERSEAAKEPPAAGAVADSAPPAKSGVAKRAAARAEEPAGRHALKGEEAYERMAAPEAAAAGAGSTGEGKGTVALGGAKWDRAEPVPAPPPVSTARAPASRPALSDAERAPAAPAPIAEPTPAPSQRARSMAAAERRAATPSAAAPMAEDRAEVQGVETRSFTGCPGERRRIVERDAAGRVVRYLRVGEDATVEHRYGADGRLVSAVVVVGGDRHVLPLDAPGLVRDARDAGIDAPPRCSR